MLRTELFESQHLKPIAEAKNFVLIYINYIFEEFSKHIFFSCLSQY